jgi:hypothetical protein
MSIKSDARAGDWLEARGIHGEPPRRGEILEVIGRPDHERFRVRWDERHESIVVPADGVSVMRRARSRARRRR